MNKYWSESDLPEPFKTLACYDDKRLKKLENKADKMSKWRFSTPGFEAFLIFWILVSVAVLGLILAFLS